MHDLKQSGDIENHAAGIWLLYEPSHQDDPNGKTIWFCQDKHRSMPKTPWDGPGAIRLTCNRMTTTFTEATHVTE